MPRSLYTTLGVRRILRPINHSLKIHGISKTFKKVIQNCSRDFIINLPESTKKVLKKDRVLVICNHPSQVDVLLLLASLPHRSDTYLVAMHRLLSILPSIDKHLIPVYISHRINDFSKTDWKFNILKKFHFSPEYSKEVAHQKNIENIALAAKRVDEGHLLCLFPAGGSENGRDFLPGIGHLIKNLKYPEDTKIVMAHVGGTSDWDYLRIIPFVNKFLPKFRINFSEAQDISNFIYPEARQIPKLLQDHYEKWSLPFEPLPKFQYAALYLRSFFLFLLFKG